MRSPPALSVIIPALNEEACIAATVRACAAEGAFVVVADGGSTDQTILLAETAGALVVHSPPGRARQMNAGARQAQSQFLVFVHADTVVPEGFQSKIIQALQEPGVVAGAFSMALNDPRCLYWLVGKMSTLRSKLMRLPYGDQAIFLRRDTFEQIGGYPEIPLLEDTELILRLRRLGRIRILPEAVITSSRRWKSEGAARVILRNWAIALAYACGVSAHTLARCYGPPVR